MHIFIYSVQQNGITTAASNPSSPIKSKPKSCLFYPHFISLEAAMNLKN